MLILNKNSMTPTGKRIIPSGLKITLNERSSQLVPTAIASQGNEVPRVGTWILAEEGPAAGMVLRVKSSEDSKVGAGTFSFTAEHAINILKDTILFGEVKAGTMAGNNNATKCTAKQAFQYILSKQDVWQLGSFAYTVSNPYNFNGENLFTALETVTSSLEDAYWDYDFSVYPFVLNVKRLSDEIDSEMRLARNITGPVKITIDRSTMYTVIYPVGKNNLKLSEKKLKKNTSTWGWIEHTETDQSKTTEEELRAWAQERLNNHCEPTVTVQVPGLFLAESTGEDLDRIRVNRVCRLPLPKYDTTITEKVTEMTWQDWVKEPEVVTVKLCNTQNDVASIIKQITSSSSRKNATDAKKGEEDHAWFEDTTDHVAMVAEAIIGRGPDGVDWTRVSSIIVDGTGIHQRVERHEGEIVAAWAAIDVLDDKIDIEVANAKSDTYAKIEVTASSIRSEVNSSKSTIFSTIMQTATNIYTQVGNAKSDTYSKIEQTASSIYSSVASAKSSLWSGIMQTSTNISLKVGKGEVISCINQTAETILIEAGKIALTGTTKINDVFTVISNAVGISVPLICSGNVDIGSSKVLNLYTATFQGSNPVTLTALALADVIKKATVSGNTLTLTPFIGNDITFSKATSLSGEWSSGHLEVTASPQNTKYNQYIITGDEEDTSSDSNSWYVPILAKSNPNASSSTRTGLRVLVNATSRYNAGKTQGYKNAANAMGWPVTISGATNKSSVDITYPTTGGGTSTRTLTLSKDSGGAYVKLGSSLILKVS